MFIFSSNLFVVLFTFELFIFMYSVKMRACFVFIIILATTSRSFAIWCYQCASSTPGCKEFDWRPLGYLGNPCPDQEDVCVKLIETKGADQVVTRDCLSNFRAFRTDIPADTYEGCRSASKDTKLAHYVNNSIKELDLKRDWYDETTWCFCFLDHRCNGAFVTPISMALLILSLGTLLFNQQIN